MEAMQWTFVDRSKWEPGEWDGEPDKTQFVDEATGLPCVTHRGASGSWCGYVGIPSTHPLHGKSYNDVDVHVHGGLTFADECHGMKEDGRGICHVPGPGEPDDVWWFGFDCAHLGDVSPAYPDMHDFNEQYRTLHYVKRECASLASQLARLA
jgi:hypothetical protein